MQVAADATQPSTSPRTIVRHERRPKWGLAVMIWEREGKRGYHFEDGSERAFAAEYCGMFKPEMAAPDTKAKLMAAFEKLSPKATKKKKSAIPKKMQDVPGVEEQVAVFRLQFPEGLDGEAWKKKHRGVGAKRRIKRHRDSAIAHAAEALSKQALDDLLAAGNYAEVIDRASAVLAKSDLVTKKQLEPLSGANPSSALALALRNYLHEEDADGARFDQFARRLGRNSTGRCTWPLLTALRALVNPDSDVCIKPSVFTKQALAVDPTLSKKPRLNGANYNRWVALARELRALMAGAGLEPSDMLDVYDFVWLTLRPSASDLYEEARAAAQAAETAAEKGANEPTTDKAASDDGDAEVEAA